MKKYCVLRFVYFLLFYSAVIYPSEQNSKHDSNMQPFLDASAQLSSMAGKRVRSFSHIQSAQDQESQSIPQQQKKSCRSRCCNSRCLMYTAAVASLLGNLASIGSSIFNAEVSRRFYDGTQEVKSTCHEALGVAQAVASQTLSKCEAKVNMLDADLKIAITACGRCVKTENTKSMGKPLRHKKGH